LIPGAPIPGPVTLLILDGFGDGPRNSFDATFAAAMPHLVRTGLDGRTMPESHPPCDKEL